MRIDACLACFFCILLFSCSRETASGKPVDAEIIYSVKSKLPSASEFIKVHPDVDVSEFLYEGSRGLVVTIEGRTMLIMVNDKENNGLYILGKNADIAINDNSDRTINFQFDKGNGEKTKICIAGLIANLEQFGGDGEKTRSSVYFDEGIISSILTHKYGKKYHTIYNKDYSSETKVEEENPGPVGPKSSNSQ